MANYPYDQLGTPLDAPNLEKANGNWAKIAADIASVDSSSKQRDTAMTADYTAKLLAQKNEYTGRLDLQFNDYNNRLIAQKSDYTNAINAQNVRIDNIASDISDDVLAEVIDSARINWLSPVDAFSNLSSSYPTPQIGDTSMVRTDGKVYRWSGNTWKEIQDIDPTAINEIDTRLTNKVSNLEFFQDFEKQTQKIQRNAELPIDVPTYDGSGQSVHPSVVYIPGGLNGYTFWMAHTPYPNTDDDFENPSIAVSNSGIDWVIPNGLVNPIDQPTTQELADNYHMSDTHLIYKDGVLECWYRFNKNGVIDQIMRKTSTDGVNWSPREIVMSSTSLLYLSPAVIYENGKYRVWYVTYAPTLKIHYVESTNAQVGTWSAPVEVSVSYAAGEPAVNPWHLDVFKDNGKYYLILNAFLNMGTPSSTRILMIGESTDGGLNFSGTRSMLYPTINGHPASFDNKEIYRASMVKFGATYRLYYSAQSKTLTWNIGMLTGDTVYGVNKIDMNRDNNGDTVRLRNINLKTGRVIYLSTGKEASLKNDELRLEIPGSFGARLEVTAEGIYRIKNKAGGSTGALRVKGLFLEDGILLPNTEGVFYYNNSQKRLEFHNGTSFVPVQRVGSSNTAGRPTVGLIAGYMHFDTTLNKPIWRNAANTGWVDANGTTV